MRILFYSDTVFTFGGVQRVLAEIAKMLAQKHDVTILTTENGIDFTMYDYALTAVKLECISYSDSPIIETFICKICSFLYKYIFPYSRYTSELYAKSFFLPAYKRKLVEKIREGDYDVVIGVHAYLSLHLASVKSRIRAKTVGWMHNSYEAFFEKENPYLPKLQHFFKYEMAKLDEIIVLSKVDQRKYEEQLNLCSQVIYNPLTIEVKGRVDLQSKRFLSVGRFTAGHKGFDLLIKAFALFAKTNSEWTLDIVGEGPEEEFYHFLIVKYMMQDRIKIHPFTKNIHLFYAHSSVYVLSSRWEGMPLVLMEAMAYGLPVVASDIPIVKELLEDKGVGILFSKGNVTQLAACLCDMVTCIDLKEMSEKAMAYAGNFKMNSVLRQWEEILN